MSADRKGDVTSLLKQWQSGNKQALDQVIELVYDDLYAIARAICAANPVSERCRARLQ